MPKGALKNEGCCFGGNFAAQHEEEPQTLPGPPQVPGAWKPQSKHWLAATCSSGVGAAPPLPIANKSLTSAGPARHQNEGSNWTAIPMEIIKSSLKMKLWGRVHKKQILALKSFQYILYFS